MSETVDSIVAELIVKFDRYVSGAEVVKRTHADMIRAISSTGQADQAVEQSAARQTTARRKQTDEEKAFAKEARDAVKAAAKERADAERASAKLAADAVKAAEKEKRDALKATAAEQKAAERAAASRAAAERAAAAEVVAAAEREAAAQVRRAAVVDAALARRAAPKNADHGEHYSGPQIVQPGDRAYVPRAPNLDAAPAAAAEREINHALLDRTDLQQRLRYANKEESAELRDQIAEIQRFNAYKRAGLSDEEAIARVEREELILAQQRTRAAAEQAALVERQMRAQSGAIANKLSGGGAAVAGIVGGLGVAEISHLNDEYIKLANTLRIAGVGAAEFDQVQAHLLTTANRSGTDINALADVYRGAALASHDLGASQADLLKITDAAANALRIQGRSSGEARGALLQLGHAFESGRVTAREFNSLALNLYPILQAVAKGSDQFGGSVAKLRQALLAGDISSRVFFQALLKGSDDLAERAGKATLTTAQGFNALRNSLIVYFGEADKSQGVSAALGEALQRLAGNLDTLIPAIAAIGTALTVGYIARVSAAAVATRGFGAAVLGAFGGPVGLAITAVTVGIGALAIEANSAAERGAEASRTYAELQDRLKATATGANLAAGGVKGVGTDALGAIPHVNNFAGAVGNLAQQLYNQARAARAARVETLQGQLSAGRAKEAALLGDTPDGRSASAADLHRGDFLNNAGIIYRNLAGSARSVLSGGRTDREAISNYGKQIVTNRDLERQLNEAKAAPITAADVPGGTGSNVNQPRIDKLEREIADLKKIEAGTSGKRRASIDRQIERRQQQIGALAEGATAAAATAGAYVPGAGRAGPSAATLQHKDDEREHRYSDELAQIHDRHLAAERQLAIGSEAEFAAQEAAIKSQRDKQDQDYRDQEKLKQIGEGRAAELIKQNDAAALEDLKVVALRRQVEAAQRVADAADREFDLQGQLIQVEQGLADTAEKRRAAALKQITLDEDRTRAEATRIILSTDPNVSDRERLAAGARFRGAADVADRARTIALHDNKSPGEAYRDALHPDASKRKEIIEDAEVQALDRFNASLDESIAKTLHLHGLFGDIGKLLIDMVVKRALIAPLSDGLFGKEGGSGGGGGLGGFFGGLLGKLGIGHRAAGGSVVGGVPYLVGEQRPEVFVPSSSGQVYPAGALPALGGGHGGGTVIHQSFVLDARYGITTPELLQHVNAVAGQKAAQAGQASYSASVAAAPARVQRAQTLGS